MGFLQHIWVYPPIVPSFLSLRLCSYKVCPYGPIYLKINRIFRNGSRLAPKRSQRPYSTGVSWTFESSLSQLLPAADGVLNINSPS